MIATNKVEWSKLVVSTAAQLVQPITYLLMQPLLLTYLLTELPTANKDLHPTVVRALGTATAEAAMA